MTRLQPNQLKRLDAWIERQVDQPSRPEAVRRLMECGLDAEAAAKPRRPGKKQEP